MKKILTALGGALLALAVAAPAAATGDKGNEEEPSGPVSVTITEEAECNAATVSLSAEATDLTLVVSTDNHSETVGPGESIEVGPANGAEEPVTVSWRVFGGPERDNDSPLWSIHPEVNEDYTNEDMINEINAYEEEHGDGSWGWTLAGISDTAPFVTWETFELAACPAEEETEEETSEEEEETSEEATATEEEEQSAKLPQTGAPVGLVVAAAGTALLAGAILTLAYRRRRAENSSW